MGGWWLPRRGLVEGRVMRRNSWGRRLLRRHCLGEMRLLGRQIISFCGAGVWYVVRCRVVGAQRRYWHRFQGKLGLGRVGQVILRAGLVIAWFR